MHIFKLSGKANYDKKEEEGEESTRLSEQTHNKLPPPADSICTMRLHSSSFIVLAGRILMLLLHPSLQLSLLFLLMQLLQCLHFASTSAPSSAATFTFLPSPTSTLEVDTNPPRAIVCPDRFHCKPEECTSSAGAWRASSPQCGPSETERIAKEEEGLNKDKSDKMKGHWGQPKCSKASSFIQCSSQVKSSQSRAKLSKSVKIYILLLITTWNGIGCLCGLLVLVMSRCLLKRRSGSAQLLRERSTNRSKVSTLHDTTHTHIKCVLAFASVIVN